MATAIILGIYIIEVIKYCLALDFVLIEYIYLLRHDSLL